MSPTVFRYKNFRFFFFSREETRCHIHIQCPEGEAKFWVEPEVALAYNYKLSEGQLKEIEGLVKEKKDDIVRAWCQHFAG